MLPTLSRFTAAPLLTAFFEEKSTVARASLDLGRTTASVELSEEGALLFSDEPPVPWATIREILEGEKGCFTVQPDGSAAPIRAFSASTKRYYALCATETGPPTMLVSGIPMHRIKNTDPGKDTAAKLTALGRVGTHALDTATGLGYTAIGLAERGAQVTTIELDPAAQEICRANPWSQGLFADARIVQKMGDSAEVVQEFDSERFSAILHDPPTLSLGGQLYSGAFYRQLFRVLRRGGRLFHYIGDPNSRTGSSTTAGVRRRLQEAGFSKVAPAPEAFGLTAERSR